MFVSTELAARIDRAEARMSAALGRAVVESKQRPDAFIDEIDGGVAVYAGPSSPINKMIGVGFAALPADERLQVIEEKFAARTAPLQAEVSTLADPAFVAQLTRRGYVLQGFENVLGRTISREDAQARPDDVIQIAVMKHSEDELWLDVMVTGFLSPDEEGVKAEPLPPRRDLERALRDCLQIAEFRRYGAHVDGQLVGVATCRLDDRLAQFCGAATLPAFRRRGVQSALLRRRLADAFESGCRLALMTTQPGSKSQQNGHKQGFTLLYSRAQLVKHPGTTR